MDALEDINDEGIYNINRAIKSSDKLDYKQVIQFHILGCQRAIEKTYHDEKVEALKDSIYFNIPGLPFKTKIDTMESKLEFERQVEIRYRERTNRNEMKHPIRCGLFIRSINRIYYKKLNRYLLQLIAEYEGLIGMKGNVKIGQERKQYEEPE